ncbi:MAG: tryptophan-rich sensory protein [Candidatus Andeanibacterium colombiense]|uniref:Tryptophan-rich sensory protein n=1 Tax=Candidatus Andeanibacterium colombiense TaxID=3121345 RepID=A0AAJ5X809_9SPHN|nr:MAG: tryptophan-rich sensory protein [Sphingomonadaceae bacterium]
MTVLASRAQLRASFLRWALFFVSVILLLGFASAEISGSVADNPWFASLVKPPLYPPPVAFPVAWTILYILMGLAAAAVAAAWGARGRTPALIVFVLQLALNLSWSPIFFAFHRIEGAFYIIAVMDVLVLLSVALFWRVRWQAGLLLLPYLAWLCFATYLNWEILQLNPGADGSGYSGAVQRVKL